jgi:hypothetical protein
MKVDITDISINITISISIITVITSDLYAAILRERPSAEQQNRLAKIYISQWAFLLYSWRSTFRYRPDYLIPSYQKFTIMPNFRPCWGSITDKAVLLFSVTASRLVLGPFQLPIPQVRNIRFAGFKFWIVQNRGKFSVTLVNISALREIVFLLPARYGRPLALQKVEKKINMSLMTSN